MHSQNLRKKLKEILLFRLLLRRSGETLSLVSNPRLSVSVSFPEISVYPPFAPLQDCAPSTSDVFFLFSFDTLAAFQKDGISRLGVHCKEAQEPRRQEVKCTGNR